MPAFLSPLFLIGVAAAAIPIAIHLFYRRAEPVIDFAAMRYLRSAPVEHARRRRLRELVLLALRVGALALLALAFARPYFTDPVAARSGEATMVLVDTSASLSAPGRFEAARGLAERAIREAPPAHAVGVATFGQALDVVSPVSQDRGGALAALAQLRRGAGATRYRAALQGAADAFEGRSGRIVVVTDLQQSGWDAASDAAIPDSIGVEVEDVGAPDANLAVISLRIEGADAVAMVRNYSSRTMTDQVVFTVDTRRIGAVPVSLAAGSSAEARLTLDGVTSGSLAAAITDRDGYAADNVRFAVLDATDAISVLAVTATGSPSDALYFERALAVAEGTTGFRFRSLSGTAFSALAAGELQQVSVMAVLGTRGMTQRGREQLADFVRSGGGLLIAAGPDVDADILKEALNEVVTISWSARPEGSLTFAPDDSRHPVFRVFGGAGTLNNVSFARAVRISAPADASVIARYSDGTPALVEEREAGGRVLLFGSDLNHRWNDFPLQPAFVPFVHETVRYLSALRTTRGEYVVGEIEEASAPGVITLQGRRVAINPDPRESDPARLTAETFQAGISRLNAGEVQHARTEAELKEDGQFLWWYGLLFMVVSLAAEGLIGRRLG